MKTKFVVWACLALVTVAAAAALAGGDKNRGDKGQGSVVQNQVRK